MARLGTLERAVMELLWDSTEPLTGRQVLEALADRDLAYTTVTTILDRLTRKDVVGRERVGRSFRYRALVERDALTAELLREVLDEAGAHGPAALLHFAGQASPEEVRALQDALERLERGTVDDAGR